MPHQQVLLLATTTLFPHHARILHQARLAVDLDQA
jgi:hypothetical protein